jgi:excinuclease ABC subunit B
MFEEGALQRIQDETRERLEELRAEKKNEEADRLQQRVTQDLLLLRETGTCPGVENYSRHMPFATRESPQTPCWIVWH